MSICFHYNTVTRYYVTAECAEPLHIGSANGEKQEVLLHPVTGQPFIQASSIAGVFRQYIEKQYGKKRAEQLFGSSELAEESNSSEFGSHIVFEDAEFEKTSVKIEIRPRLKINRESGSCDSTEISGTNLTSGHKFETEYIGAGARVIFRMWLFGEDGKEELEALFAAMKTDSLQFGGQRSNGCGFLHLSGLYSEKYDLTKAEGRKAWISEEERDIRISGENIYQTLTEKSTKNNAYQIIVSGKTEGVLLVKGITVEKTKDDSEGSAVVNITNAKDEFIIPGSSFKGAIRSRIEWIENYLKQKDLLHGSVVKDLFGESGSTEAGCCGNAVFYDTVVGDAADNEQAPAVSRIHLDKFTGGVMNGGLFTEKNISGDLSLRIDIQKKNHPERALAVLLLALRDLAAGAMNLGSGYNVGKGFIKISAIQITDGDKKAELNIQQKKQKDPDGLLADCMKALRETI